LNLRERLREGLRRTREKLGLAPGSAPWTDLESLRESLVLADVGIAASEEILESLRARPGDVRENLKRELLDRLAGVRKPDATDGASPRVTLIVGVNGVGKTTSVAKLSRRLAREGKKVLVVAADTFRAAAQEQLATWAERAGVDLASGEPGRDPASVVHEGLSRALTQGYHEVVVDTAGRLHTKRPLMDELAKVGRIAARLVPGAPHETLLVLDATVGTNGLLQARQFVDALPVTGILLTKMDGTARGGVVFAIAKELGLPVRFAGVGEGLDDLLPFAPEAFVDALLSD
jgi:fused signal recognition particle receptor